MVGRPHILLEIKHRLAGRVMSVSIGSKGRDNTIRCLHNMLAADTTLNNMDSALEGDIPKEILNDISEIYSTRV